VVTNSQKTSYDSSAMFRSHLALSNALVSQSTFILGMPTDYELGPPAHGTDACQASQYRYREHGLIEVMELNGYQI
jgi:hypothetical protein